MCPGDAGDIMLRRPVWCLVLWDDVQKEDFSARDQEINKPSPAGGK